MRISSLPILFCLFFFGEISLCKDNSLVICSKNVVSCRDVGTKTLESSRITIHSNTPHRQLNAAHKDEVYSGYEIKKLLLPSENTDNSNDVIYFVGDDGYVARVPISLITNSSVILADKKDNVPMTRRDGGLQVIYPTSSDSSNAKIPPEKYLRKAAFWAWYVTTVVVGEFQNKILIDDKLVKLSEKTGQKNQVEFVNPSIFSYEPIRCPQTQVWSLDVVQSQSGKLVVKDLTGRKQTLAAQDYDLVGVGGDRALSVFCGGPFALQKKNDRKSIIYHIVSLTAG